MSTTYVIHAMVARDFDGGDGIWRQSRQIPTFLLHSDIQGIVSAEHAEKIARDIIDPWGEMDVSVTATVAGRWVEA